MELKTATYLVLATLSVTLGLIGLIVGAAGDSWWENDFFVFGLWNFQTKGFYVIKITRSDVLHFGEDISFG